MSCDDFDSKESVKLSVAFCFPRRQALPLGIVSSPLHA
jgi:hypothetical protein